MDLGIWSQTSISNFSLLFSGFFFFLLSHLPEGGDSPLLWPPLPLRSIFRNWDTGKSGLHFEVEGIMKTKA